MLQPHFIYQLSVKSLFLRKILGVLSPKFTFNYVNRCPNKFNLSIKKRILLFISFDIDCPQDGDAIPELCKRLDEFKLPCNWAVIGSLLEKSSKVYKPITKRDDEVLNHGYSPHNLPNKNGIYEASLSYADLAKEDISNEIVKNQKVIHQYLAVIPKGFRTPHFGTFMQNDQINGLYNILENAGIFYSSSTFRLVDKFYAMRKGNHTITEIPFSARVGSTLSCFDSWSYLESPKRRRSEKDFFPDFKKIIDFSLQSSEKIFLNFYFDPSHVVSCNSFFDCLEYIVSHRESIYVGIYPDLLKSTNNSLNKSPYSF